jgi:DNA-binding transcriptional MerR regulator
MGPEAPSRVNPSPLKSEFSSREVAQVARVSLAQLQWWDERGILSPGRKGRKRAYLPKDVIEVLVIAELRRKGMSLQSVRRVLRLLRRESDEWLAPVVSGEADLHLLTDGKSVYLEDEPAAIIDRLKAARRAAFLIGIGDQAKRLRDFQEERLAHKGARRRPRTAEDQLPLFS